MDNKEGTFGNVNPFMSKDAATIDVGVTENPFLSSFPPPVVPVTAHPPLVPVTSTSLRVYNIFDKSQDNTAQSNDSQSIFRSKEPVTTAVESGAKNPFLSELNLTKSPFPPLVPITAHPPLVPVTCTSLNVYNIFDKGQDNTAQSNDSQSIFQRKEPVMTVVESADKNPFLSGLNLVKSPTSEQVEVGKPRDTQILPNPFLDSAHGTTASYIKQAKYVKNEKEVDKIISNETTSIKPQNTYHNPFLSTKSGGRSSPFFTPPPEAPIETNIFSQARPFPVKVGEKKIRSLNEVKRSLSLLAGSLKTVTCTDSESKFDVLEKVDKAIRKGVKSNFHIQDGSKRYRALKGICMDMCPEKERYFRDDKHQISAFELPTVQDIVSTVDGSYPPLDHCKAVKEYSRSSADQEEPLPHQLRTTSVLRYTMDHLIFNIMDIKYSNRSDWFDFLWNRTRAIRKDITQQNLSCPQIISIIENCARFHIFSSHFLCDQELHVFDPKMNLENLTKCLQTLKHMYEDRWKDNNEVCDNESEFRCYQILLNLNDGDMLREVVHFRKEIRESSHVKFALRVFSTVHDNNYVRFFKLLKSTSYLNACLLRPYFNQIRGSALATMVRTFSQPNTDILYSLESFQNILAFDDAEEAAEFCHHYSLITHDSYIYFNRSSFSKPEDPFPQTMSLVVGGKLQLTMAEVVNNGPLKCALDVYTPVNSFSDAGVYVGSYHQLDEEAFNESVIEEVKDEKDVVHVIEVQEDVIEVASETSIEVVNSSSDDEVEEADDAASHVDDPDFIASEESGEDFHDDDDKPDGDNNYESDKEDVIMFLREDYVAYVDELVNEEISNCIENMFSSTVTEIKDELTQSQAMTDQMVAIICIEEARIAVSEVIDEEHVKIEEDRQHMIEGESIIISNNIIEDTVTSMLKPVCRDVYKEVIDILEEAVLTDELEQQGDKVLNIVINQEVAQLASDVIIEASIHRANLLESKRQAVLKKKMGKMFSKWIMAYKRQQFIKSSLIDFPPLPPLISTKEAVHRLHPDGDISYSLPNFSEKTQKKIPVKTNNDNLQTVSIDKGKENISEEGNLSKPLSVIIEDGMSLLFFKKFHEHCLYCERLGLPTADPNDIITFYNNALSSIKDGIKVSITNRHLKDFHYLITTLQLPFLDQVDLYNWDLSCAECEDFIFKVTSNKSSILLSRVNKILDRYISQSLENVDILFPWSEILEACIFSKMSCMYFKESKCDNVDFQSLVYCEPEVLCCTDVVNPLKRHVKTKRSEHFALQQSLTYKDEMKRKKFTREYQLRRSLDSVSSELDQLEATMLKKAKSSMTERSSSLQDLCIDSNTVLENVDFVKRNQSYNARSFSSSVPTTTEEEENELCEEVFTYDKQTGSKRSFEHSMMECLKGIGEYRMKLKTREDYWRKIISQ